MVTCISIGSQSVCLVGEVVYGRFILILYGLCRGLWFMEDICIHRLHLGQVIFYWEADFFFFFFFSLALGWDQK